MAPVRLSCPTPSCLLAPCSVNDDSAQLHKSWDHLWHCKCASWGIHLITGYFVLYICMSFTMKALATVAPGLHWRDIMIVLYEVMLWLHYCYIMVKLWLLLWLLHHPGERLHYVCHASQERIICCSSFGSLSLLPSFYLMSFLSWAQQTVPTVWTGSAIHTG